MYQPKAVPSPSLVHDSLVHGQHSDCGANTMDPINGGNSLNNNSSLASKQRLRWTHELHERFVDAVAQLGGPDRELHPLSCWFGFVLVFLSVIFPLNLWFCNFH